MASATKRSIVAAYDTEQADHAEHRRDGDIQGVGFGPREARLLDLRTRRSRSSCHS